MTARRDVVGIAAVAALAYVAWTFWRVLEVPPFDVLSILARQFTPWAVVATAIGFLAQAPARHDLPAPAVDNVAWLAAGTALVMGWGVQFGPPTLDLLVSFLFTMVFVDLGVSAARRLRRRRASAVRREA